MMRRWQYCNFNVYVARPAYCLLTRCEYVRVRSTTASLLSTVSKQ